MRTITQSVIKPDRLSRKADMVDDPLEDHLMLPHLQYNKTFFRGHDAALGGAGQTLIEQSGGRLNLFWRVHPGRIIASDGDAFYIFNFRKVKHGPSILYGAG